MIKKKNQRILLHLRRHTPNSYTRSSPPSRPRLPVKKYDGCTWITLPVTYLVTRSIREYCWGNLPTTVVYSCKSVPLHFIERFPSYITPVVSYCLRCVPGSLGPLPSFLLSFFRLLLTPPYSPFIRTGLGQRSRGPYTPGWLNRWRESKRSSSTSRPFSSSCS